MSGKTNPGRGFELAEFESRLSGFQARMTAAEFDVVLLTAPPNVRYFSGFDTQFWESPTRPWYLVLPRQGQPVAVIPEIGEAAMRATWVEDVHCWPAPQPADDGVSLLAGVLDAVPRKFGRLGAEMGRESIVRMPLVELAQVQARVAGLEWADASPILWAQRFVKSPAEVARIHHICQITSDAFEALPASLKIGDTERDACRKLRIDLLARGADTTPYMPGISGPGGYDQIIVGPTDRVLGDGDVLIIDTGTTYDGYFCDFDRNFAFGHLDDAAARAHDAVWLATEAGIAAARPGATCEDVWAVMAKVLEDAGSIGNNVGRMGHGLGLQLTEPPSNTKGDQTELVPGAVLTIEPGMEYAPGKMIVHEENLVITEDGAELLSRRAPREMPVIA